MTDYFVAAAYLIPLALSFVGVALFTFLLVDSVTTLNLVRSLKLDRPSQVVATRSVCTNATLLVVMASSFIVSLVSTAYIPEARPLLVTLLSRGASILMLVAVVWNGLLSRRDRRELLTPEGREGDRRADH